MTVIAQERRGAQEQRGSDFARLSREIAAAGLMRRRPGRYAVTIGLTALLFAGSWVAFVFVGNSWWTLAIGALCAIATTQVAFLGHDAGHKQMFRSRRAAEVAGLTVGNLATGLSFGWWVDKHNRHHANPNHEDHDPDVGEGVIVWTEKQAAKRTGWGRWFARNQARLFFPLLTLEGLNLHVSSIKALFNVPMRHRRTEALLLVMHTIGYFALVFSVLPPGKALAFMAVHQGLWGVYMGMSFAPNHKGMPVLTAADELDFLRKQVLTSRNVLGGKWVDVVLGGLNYQVEHHLFPSMPRANLRRAAPIVRAYCAEHNIPYHWAGMVESYRQALTYMHNVAR
ncbi:Fatty acid desaturase [Asanoa ishikariensis]|uniref:Fatty acid desaturase n=1 Tax=Asanoa ishikariensis TaxID=137265 RepID=A0A1H3R582_9ACTN|nr:acyl-CoA desaturase [Asanoa ishikariensis]SDZ20109.1 Fatty acid desaturase [Asanoa ishikariensis]